MEKKEMASREEEVFDLGAPEDEQKCVRDGER